MNSFSIILISYKTKNLVDIAIRSFEKYKPKDFTLNYYIVETSDDTSYQDFVQNLASNVTFISYPEAEKKQRKIAPVGGSFANGYGIELGKEHVVDDYTFVCHSDICITSPSFFDELKSKVDEGYKLIGMSYDASRIKAAHQSGLLVSSDILRKCNTLPQLPEMDVGDSLTKHCRDNNIPYCVFPCSFNDPSLVELLNEPFKSLGADCGVDRTLDSDNNVMFMHLGRGTTKKHGQYRRRGKISHAEWLDICDKVLS